MVPDLFKKFSHSQEKFWELLRFFFSELTRKSAYTRNHCNFAYRPIFGPVLKFSFSISVRTRQENFCGLSKKVSLQTNFFWRRLEYFGSSHSDSQTFSYGSFLLLHTPVWGLQGHFWGGFQQFFAGPPQEALKPLFERFSAVFAVFQLVFAALLAVGAAAAAGCV